MNKILVLNCGSSSIKYKLFDKKFNELLDGLIEKIGEEGAMLVHRKAGKELKKKIGVKSHKDGIALMIKMLHDADWGAIKRVTEISVIGHRVVHGGQMAKSALVSPVALGYLRLFTQLAPLHNPHNITGIMATKKAMPTVPQAMVFDTAFHQTMPRKAFMYALPYRLYDKYAIRKYGFHGMSHKYVSMRVAKLLGKKNANVITCHLGAGCSIAAVKAGKSVDTSMGLTPLEGVMMGTRMGDADPAIVQYLVNRYGFGMDELFDMMNKESGLLGISGVSKDMRVINGMAKKGNERCKLAIEMFCYRVAKYIGAYSAVLGKVDAIVFTAGIGENAWFIREEICGYLTALGVKLDKKKNKAIVDRKEGEISSTASEVTVLVIPTNEELMIAQEAVAVIGK